MEILKKGTWLVPSIEDAKACENIGGKMEQDVCILVDGPDGGWTAPVKGSYFWWGALDMYEATGDKRFENRFIPDVSSCLVADSPVYPTFAGMCSPFYQSEFDEVEGKEEAMELAKDEALWIAKDVLAGDAKYWGLDYFKPTGRKARFDEENAVVARDSDLVVGVYQPREQKRLEEFFKQRRK